MARVVNKKWAEVFKQFDLSPAHGYMLRVVLSNPGISPKQLAEELRLEKSTITRFIDALQDKGFIVRSRHNTIDSRELSIYPTEKAKEIHIKLEEVGDYLYQNMASKIGTENIELLVSRLRKAIKQIE